jgi:replicative DNA helicase
MIDETVRADEPVLYVQRELSRSRAIGRLAARKVGIPWNRVELRRMKGDESERLEQSVLQYRNKFPLHLATIGRCNASTIGPLIKLHKKQHGCKLVVVDYIQLIDVPRGVERRVAIGDLMYAMKRAANETGVTVIAIAQLDRGLDKSADKPRLADLRESGDIEQNADSVLALWTSMDRNEASRWPVNWSILKNRNGGLGTEEIIFDGPSMSFLGKVVH